MKKSYINNKTKTVNKNSTKNFIVSKDTVLTPREQKVIEYAAQGLDNGQIAKELYISTHTVKVHMASALKKLSAINRTQAVYLAVKYHLID